MTDKITIQRAFNSHFVELLDDISSVYPENADIVFGKKSLENMKRLNPTILVKGWYKYVNIPYGSQIDSGNLDFFFEKDYTSDLSHLHDMNEILNLIDKIRGPLQNMCFKNKEHTSSYLKNLNKLSFLYHELS
jgi:hypothetical protein